MIFDTIHTYLKKILALKNDFLFAIFPSRFDLKLLKSLILIDNNKIELAYSLINMRQLQILFN